MILLNNHMSRLSGPCSLVQKPDMLQLILIKPNKKYKEIEQPRMGMLAEGPASENSQLEHTSDTEIAKALSIGPLYWGGGGGQGFAHN